MDAVELYHALLGAYGTPRWWSDDPYTVMVQAVLVQNTSWRNVEKAYGEAGGRLRPEYVLATSAEELEALIRPCGFQKAKARTIMALTAPETLRFQKDMLAGRAVVHDLTRAALVPKGYTGPTIAPETAGEHLLAVAGENDLTLFEFFLTDIAGHSQDYARAAQTLGALDAFLRVVLEGRPEDTLLVVTSDHGNIEDLGTRGHTFNQVPLIAVGPGAEAFCAGAKSLTDVMPRVLRVLG